MLKRFILWDFPRGSRQYDVMVGIILAFVFLTPRLWFRDKPRIPNATKISADVYAVDSELLTGVPEAQRPFKAGEIIQHLPGSRERENHPRRADLRFGRGNQRLQRVCQALTGNRRPPV